MCDRVVVPGRSDADVTQTFRHWHSRPLPECYGSHNSSRLRTRGRGRRRSGVAASESRAHTPADRRAPALAWDKSQIKFLELAATTLKDELLGFHLAQSVDLRLMGLLYYVMASSETLEEVLRRGARYSSIVNEGIAPKYREGKDTAYSSNMSVFRNSRIAIGSRVRW